MEHYCTSPVYYNQKLKWQVIEMCILMSQYVISIQEIIPIAHTMAKRTEFPFEETVDLRFYYMPRSRPIYEVNYFSHGKRYPNDLLDADKC